MRNKSSYIIYVSEIQEKVDALHKPLLNLKNIHTGWYWHISTVPVLQDCRIPPMYHGENYWATIIEHNNGDWEKATTYEIHCI